MQLCSFGLCDLRHQVHWINQCFQMLPIMLTKISTIKTLLKTLKLQLQFVLDVSTQLGHPQATHLL
jgi:hypothetical protein